MSKHTSGPWQSRDDQTTDGFVTIIGNIDGEILHDGPSYTYDVICVCEDEFGERLPNVAANVRLITAAPSMLETLQQLEYWFNTDAEILDAMSDAERADHIRQHEKIRKAIAKALGEQA